jgi:3'(2'), 5'-bisphosphate nucleotidase/inositol polyphosphate 1-phosphatase
LSSFLRGDQYAVALALLDNGEVVLGVLACPNLPLKGILVQDLELVGCLFSARKGAGTMLQSLDGHFAPKKVHML